MRRLLIPLLALGLIVTVAAPAGARRRSSCGSPHTSLTMTNGVFGATGNEARYDNGVPGTSDFLDMWSADSSTQANMTSCSLGNWTVDYTDTSPTDPRVVGYIKSEVRWTDWTGNCSQHFDWYNANHLSLETQGETPSTTAIWDQASDIWLGGDGCTTASQEIMTWDRYTAGNCDYFAVPPHTGGTSSFTTADGVAWHVCWNDNTNPTYIQVRRDTQVASNAVVVTHVKQVLGKLANITVTGDNGAHALVATNNKVRVIDYGLEFVNPTPSETILTAKSHEFSYTAN